LWQVENEKPKGRKVTLPEACGRASLRFCELKSAACKRFGGPTDLVPVVEHMLRRDSRVWAQACPDYDPIMSFPRAWEVILKHGLPDRVVLMTDGSYRCGSDASHQGHGQDTFGVKDNPPTDVGEVLCIFGLETRAGRQCQILIPYTYDALGLPVFKNVLVSNKCGPGNADHGVIPRLLAECFQQVCGK
jgi:hypothetical protein